MKKIIVGGIERIINDKESPPDFRDYSVDVALKDVKYPEEIDPRKELLPIRDQGSQGSCSAMAATAIKEIHEKSEYQSPQFVYNLRENDGPGMYPRNTMKILKGIGSVLEEKFPYGENTKTVPLTVKKSASKYRIKAYGRIHTVEAAKKAIAENGGFYISVPVWDFRERMWHKKHDRDQKVGNHAMAVVGYNKEGFIIRNSWGDNWGTNGYTIMPYEDWEDKNEAWSMIDITGLEQELNLPHWFWVAIGSGIGAIGIILAALFV